MTTPYSMNVSNILEFFNKTSPNALWANPSVSAGITQNSTLAPLDYLQNVSSGVGSGGSLSEPILSGLSPSQVSNILPGMNAVTGQATTFMDKMMGYEGKNGYVPGWGGMAMGAASGIGQSLMSMKQYGLMEDQLKEQKRQFDINYGMQKKSFNSQLEDRQRARVASNASAYQSVGDYMNKYGA